MVRVLTSVHSLSFFKRNTISFWPKHRRQRPVIVPAHAARSRMISRPTQPTSPHIRKLYTPSRPVRHTRRGSYPLLNESRPINPFQRRPNRAQNPVTTGRDPTKSRGVWVSALMARALTGVVARIQPRPLPWDLMPPAVTSIPWTVLRICRSCHRQIPTAVSDAKTFMSFFRHPRHPLASMYPRHLFLHHRRSPGGPQSDPFPPPASVT